jgi:hypothetical protein
MVGFEMPPRVVHELPVAWMVYSLDRDNLLYERRRVLTDVLHKLRLFVARASDEDCARIRQRVGDPLEKVVVLGCISAADALRLVV